MFSKSFLFTEPYYLTDGGLETTLIFHKGITLKYFAAFELLQSKEGKKALEDYFKPYLELAEKFAVGFVAESPTWRASADWGSKMGYTHDELFALNRQSIKFIRELVQPYSATLPQLLISGNIGPRGDGYKADNKMTSGEAQAYHSEQVRAFAFADADVVSAVTITYSDEAIGIINAAKAFNLPVVISFTVETDGSLPGGESLRQAIERTDAETGHYAEHFMINCAHPGHFMHVLKTDEAWIKRIRGVRANASCKSHAELDESESLDMGDKRKLADGYSQLFELLPQLQVIGGCCGTDHSHLEEICQEVKARFPSGMHFKKTTAAQILTSIHSADALDSTLKELTFRLSNGDQLSYVEQGRREGTTVIFLHGYSDSWISFKNVLALLPGDIHAVAISMRGHGNSSKPASGYRLKEFAADVAAFIEEEKLGSCILVGHSMGGLIVQQFALDYPQFTKAIVIVSSDTSFGDNPGLPEFKNEILSLTDTIEYEFAETFQKSTLAKPIDTSFLETCIAQSVMMPVHVWKAAVEEIFEADYTHQLKDIKAPALILWGSNDTFCPRNDQEAMHKNLKGSTLLIYEGTGHALHWEEPGRFVNDLLIYLKSLGMNI